MQQLFRLVVTEKWEFGPIRGRRALGLTAPSGEGFFFSLAFPSAGAENGNSLPCTGVRSTDCTLYSK